jgi:hypothetical protein
LSDKRKENDMKRSIVMAATLSTVLLGVMSASQGQLVVGSTQLGLAVAELPLWDGAPGAKSWDDPFTTIRMR